MEPLKNADISFETIFNHVNEGVLIVNSSGEILLTNPKLAEMFGYQESDLAGEKVDAKYVHGILKLTLPKREEAKSIGKKLIKIS